MINIVTEMNSYERKSFKRALYSLSIWKDKAQKRQKEIRLLQLKIRDLERSRELWRKKYFLHKTETQESKKLDQEKNYAASAQEDSLLAGKKK